ncbi:MAG TPA: TPM domain-containing protein [Spirochaetota bacterium]|nr:MAG: hypothetical protein BWX91_01776 [Spirochaetes bacterium ADurb.Bin133]HNZ26528.1 TPM domain-containing protein [Spirochaetota bacterium]HPY88124.1 TPM domain-containing protein [Spirochaetota bacterium]
MKKKLVLFFVLLFAPLYSLEVPYLSSRVNDYANLLSYETKARIENKLSEHEKETSNQVVVLTIFDLKGENLEEFSLKVAETWGIGQKDKDNGVLLLISLNDRKLRIEVGYGLEGSLTDYTASSIIRNDIVPYFKSGDYEKGIENGVDSILSAIAGTYTGATDEDGYYYTDIGEIPILVRLFMGLMFFSVIGVFTASGLFTRGFVGWFLYLFLSVFWASFPMVIFGPVIGIAILVVYLIGYPVAKILFATKFKKAPAVVKITKYFSSSGRGGGGGFSRGGGFSGGGGSFGGGGSSGSW